MTVDVGGVVAAMGWVSDPRVEGVALFASYAAGSTDVEAMAASLLGWMTT